MQHGWNNVVENNGLGIACLTLVAVFSGLVLLSLFLKALPAIIAFAENALSNDGEEDLFVADDIAEAKTEDDSLSDDELAAIAMVLEKEFSAKAFGELQRITMHNDGSPQSSWGIAGKMRVLGQGSKS